MTKSPVSCLIAFALLLFSADASLAHRVNVFAYVDGDAVQVECSFSKSQKVRYGKLVFSDLETGDMLLKGTTDEQGLFRFRPDAAFLSTGHGLSILLDAGEGHQNDWQVAPEELAALSPAALAEAAKDMQPVLEQPNSAHPATSFTALDHAELEILIGKVMDAKLAPIRQALVRQQDSGPSLKDVVGGIGWILGLLGLATYMRYRPK